LTSAPKLDGFHSVDVPSFRRRLIAWYSTYQRQLPWRLTRDPYRIWISEIMLQQTRVAAVIAHYHEFLRRFPTVEKLAEAREASVLATWSGLGYYRRARMLHAAARTIRGKHGGEFPRTGERLLELPGVGRYTAAAIASIAFGEAVAVVDGNVERVLQRVSGKAITGNRLWSAANYLLDAEQPGDFNQAMMELGATVCTPRRPACPTCPISEMCATRGETSIAKSAPQRKREVHYSLICRAGKPDRNEVFLVRRPRNASLMAGMWELPERLRANSAEKEMFMLRHSITVTNYTVRVWAGSSRGEREGKWFRNHKLASVPLTGLARKILSKAGMINDDGHTEKARRPQLV
jgi:A/G-specific adenine glycosylase